MSVDAFLDTNILLYAASENAEDSEKKHMAIKLLANTSFGTSAQVFQEFYVNATNPRKLNLTSEQALSFLQSLQELPFASTTQKLFHEATTIAKRYQITYWDGAVIAGAKNLGATTLFTEDLQHGQLYSGILVKNPFK